MEVKNCPWCQRYATKDERCNWVKCGEFEKAGFLKDHGCGRAWCFQCEKKLCGAYYDPKTGTKLPSGTDQHTKDCCLTEEGFTQEAYCGGGHHSHTAKRW
jgi:hypothetical protein